LRRFGGESSKNGGIWAREFEFAVFRLSVERKMRAIELIIIAVLVAIFLVDLGFINWTFCC
ncbi:MAG: hypothetical protein HC894_09285, partial [Microcoleus sp. SM1_3_4]|nr:hypothetical protein [Microcoleus sp. SM1_3_4]